MANPQCTEDWCAEYEEPKTELECTEEWCAEHK